ncbi:MAG: transcriptional regulator [Calditrichales bacterium]|nr:transcriptional regulator [Calditrichales bacterium]
MARGEQLSRQWQLLRVLESFRYGITVPDLAERIECSTRTIERDLKALTETGFPVSCEIRDDSRRFWRLEKHFLESDKIIVSPTEMVALYLARQLMAPISGTCFGYGLEELWKKIKALIPREALEYFLTLDETFYVRFYESAKEKDKKGLLDIVHKAINENRVVRIVYSPDGKDVGYTTMFHPFGLILYEGSMYAIGYSVRAEDIRTFKLKRLTEIYMTKKTFSRPKDFSLEKCIRGSFGIISREIKPITVRCEFRGWAARMIREQKWHRTQVIEKDDGDELLASFLLDTTTEFQKWILGFGPFVRLIEPSSLVNDITDSLKKALENYLK